MGRQTGPRIHVKCACGGWSDVGHWAIGLLLLMGWEQNEDGSWTCPRCVGPPDPPETPSTGLDGYLHQLAEVRFANPSPSKETGQE